ncbi:lisH domain-containing protein ARMC9 [Anabrus simplex]|uniref:lisH domain-containing protein ARMC9 n=1 Tax=Anabrus simplex TaxID=316456 RepID=UPI0035A37A80
MQERDNPLRELNQEEDCPNITAKEETAIELETRCIRLIQEFLLSYGFELSAESFIKECVQQEFAVPEPPVVYKERIKRKHVHLILEHFASNDDMRFYNAWESLIPLSIQQKLEYKKLTFYLHIHFAVLPLRSQEKDADENENEKSDKDEDYVYINGDAEESEEKTVDLNGDVEVKTESGSLKMTVGKEERPCSMETLRQFLETKGTEFSAEPEFLPYYALPFINDPTTHPSFQELFTDQWVLCLTNSLRQFLEEHSWGSSVVPQLVLMCGAQQSHLPNRSHNHVDTHNNYKQLRRRYHKLYKDHHNLLSVATELTSALESSVKGHSVDLEATLRNCSKLFPELFNCTSRTDAISEVQEDSLTTPVPYELDFKKIKHHLVSGSVKTKLLLLQALRWRITRSNLDERDSALSSFVRHDVLSLYRGPGPSLLSTYFAPTQAITPHPLQQAAARLVNTLASLRSGRDYLCGANCRILSVLVPCLKGERGINIDSITLDMILATLQKLSLRHSQRVWMLEAGLVEWLVCWLSNEAVAMKAYALEYSTALLMNLCLHRRAKERCVPLAKTVLKMLTDLLGTELTQAVPYVNGTLYSLLANTLINHEAKRMGLSSILEYYLKHSGGEMHKQLEYILKLHRGDCQPDHSATSEEENADDDTEEVDLLEDELDADDPVRTTHGELSGEELLHQQYRLLFPYHGVVYPSSSSSAQAGEPLVRPTTPHRHSPPSSSSSGGIGSASNKSSSALLPNLLEQVQEFTEAEDPSEALEEQVDVQENSIILENLDSEIEKDDDVVCHTQRSSVDGQCSTNQSGDTLQVETQPGCENKLLETSQPTSAGEDGCYTFYS